MRRDVVPIPVPRPDSPPAPGPRPGRNWGVAPAVGLMVVLVAAGAVVCAPAPSPGGPTTPAPRHEAWLDQHRQYAERAARGGVDMLFLGDSITQGWSNQVETWGRFYKPRKADNFGVDGDSTQNVLWRLDHGELDGIAPRVVVLMIGTNNLAHDTPAEIAEGVDAILGRIRSRLPETKILLLGVFPRDHSPHHPLRYRVEGVNARLARLADGKNVVYLDIGRDFLNPDGTLSNEIMPDFLHLSPRGYRIWADAMEPTLWRLYHGG